MHYFLNIGSNLGNRRLNISRALRALEAHYGWFETSAMMESAPWGFVSPNRFANIAVMIVTDESPRKVLEVIHGIEDKLNSSPHRGSNGGYNDREVDIDIMAADEETINEEGLRIPHEHLAERDFFLKPFNELAPLWKHPATGLTCSQMLSVLPKKED